MSSRAVFYVQQHEWDPLVQAGLRENAIVYDQMCFAFDWKEWFREATHLERLALLRNPAGELSYELIEKILDPANEELRIDLAARRELVLAFLTNEEAVNHSRKREEDFGFDGLARVEYGKHFSQMWELASKWAEESVIPLVT